jgi:hypothetical protein
MSYPEYEILAGRCIRAVFLLLFFVWPSALYAQTLPPCSTAAHAGNSYETCTAGLCERMVCNGTAYVVSNAWGHAGWESIKIGDTGSVCNPERRGSLRYLGGEDWQFCSGTNWVKW